MVKYIIFTNPDGITKNNAVRLIFEDHFREVF